MAKKRLNLTREDKVTGMLPREKKDLFAGCNEPGKPWFNRDDYEFMKSFCSICKNADCLRAKGAVSPWHTRMAEQVDYLLNDPEFSDLNSSSHRELAQMAFDDLTQRAMRLEVARRRQDWNIPEAPTDGVDKVVSPETTDQFDDAVRALAEAKGKKLPELERPAQSDSPAHFQQPEDPVVEVPQDSSENSEWEYDTQYPSSDGTRTYHVTLSKRGEWACECKGFQHRQTCKHLDTVRAWYEDQLAQAREQERREAEQQAQERNRSSAPAPTRDPRVPDHRYNTPMPQGGVMVGGAERPPEPQPSSVRSAEPEDPWAPRKDKTTVVKPGAVVTLTGSKKSD